MRVEDQESRIQAARELREQLLRDPHRPGYHFAIPEDMGQPGDPNGAFYARGRYHLMYLYDRRGAKGRGGHAFSWGHLSSHDLVHWRHHPDALLPGDGDGGCFSGGAFVDDDGTAYLTYWRLPVSESGPEGTGIGIATSRDRHFERWEKREVPTLDGTEMGFLTRLDAQGRTEHLCNADPSNIWKKGEHYYLQAGNLGVLNKLGREPDAPPRLRGDWVDLFRSRDLRSWEYVHRFYARDARNSWTDESEDDMCPSFLPLPASPEGGRASGRHLQLFIAHNRGCQYYIGTYDERRDLFLPESHGRMSWVDNTFFAPEALIDARGRQIMWAWLLDNPNADIRDDIRDGWSGVYGLPRALWLGEDGTLRMRVPPELEVLRCNARAFADLRVEPDSPRPIEPFNGMSCEVHLSLNMGSARAAGLQVRTAPDGSETTLVYYDAAARQLVFDATRSGGAGRRVVELAPLDIRDGQELELRVFVDNSVVEVYANDRQAITRRVYPTRTDSDGVRLFCRGGRATFRAIETWEMMPSNGW